MSLYNDFCFCFFYWESAFLDDWLEWNSIVNSYLVIFDGYFHCMHKRSRDIIIPYIMDQLSCLHSIII